MYAVFAPLLTAALLILVDQLTKLLVMNTMTLGQSIVLIPGLFEFHYVHNPGAAMGLMQNIPHSRVILIILTIAVVVGVIWAIATRRIHSRLALWAVTLILAGGVGNLIDRIFRGVVVDFMLFEFSWFPFVFNVADIFVVVGGGLIVWYLVREIVREKRAQTVKGGETHE